MKKHIKIAAKKYINHLVTGHYTLVSVTCSPLAVGHLYLGTEDVMHRYRARLPLWCVVALASGCLRSFHQLRCSLGCRRGMGSVSWEGEVEGLLVRRGYLRYGVVTAVRGWFGMKRARRRFRSGGRERWSFGRCWLGGGRPVP